MANVVCYNTPLYFQYSASCEGKEGDEQIECQKKEKLKTFLIEKMNMLILDSQYDDLVQNLDDDIKDKIKDNTKIDLKTEHKLRSDIVDKQRRFFILNRIEDRVKEIKFLLGYNNLTKKREQLNHTYEESQNKVKSYLVGDDGMMINSHLVNFDNSNKTTVEQYINEFKKYQPDNSFKQITDDYKRIKVYQKWNEENTTEEDKITNSNIKQTINDNNNIKELYLGYLKTKYDIDIKRLDEKEKNIKNNADLIKRYNKNKEWFKRLFNSADNYEITRKYINKFYTKEDVDKNDVKGKINKLKTNMTSSENRNEYRTNYNTIYGIIVYPKLGFDLE